LAPVVLAVGVVCALHVGKLPIAIPALQQELGIGLMESGWLLSLLQLAGLLLGLPVGLLADQWGPQRVMFMGLALLCVGSFWALLTQNAEGILWSRVLEGLGFLWAVLPAPALLRERIVARDALSRALGWWGAYMPLGTALALWWGSVVLNAWGWQGVWLVLMVLTALAAAALGVTLKRSPLPSVSGAFRRKSVSVWEPVQRTLSSPGPWLLALAFFCYSGQWMAVIGFLPTIYTAAGYDASTLGVLTALAAGVNLLGNVAAGRWMAQGVHPAALLIVGYTCMGVGAAGAFSSNLSAGAQYAAVLLFSAVGGLIPGTLFALSVRLAPDASCTSSTVGWMQQGSAAGQFIGPLGVAWAATVANGWQHTPWITGASSILGVGLTWVLTRCTPQNA